MRKYLKKKRFYIILFCLIGFLAITIFVLKKGILNIDNKSYEFINNNIINDNLTPIVKIFTNLGGALVLIGMSLIIMFIIKDKKISMAILINLISVFLLNQLMKLIFQRSRPDRLHWLINEIGYSFPSGHAMISMAYYGFLIYLVYTHINKKYKWILIILLSVIIILVGLSRIYLGVHYLSDILAGFLVSIAYLIIFVFCYNKYINSTKSLVKSTKKLSIL